VNIEYPFSGKKPSDGGKLLVMGVLNPTSAFQRDGVVDFPEIVSVQMSQTNVSLSEVQHVAGRILQPGVDIILTVVVPCDRDDELGLGFDIRFFDTRVNQQKCDNEQKNKAHQRIE
jgi:hypothetical protein